MKIERPYLLYLGDAGAEFGAKTAAGVLFWRPEHCLAQSRLPGCAIDLGLPDMTFEDAVAQGARTLLIGVTNMGGFLPEHWVPDLVRALEAGLDIASGLHQRLSSFPAIAETAEQHGRRLHDVRHPGTDLPMATGQPRSGQRVLMVGTDCAVGKKFSALAIHREMVARRIDADFRATGQTGALIAGSGFALDAVPGDFISGCAEALSPAAHPDHWDVIEGQATVLHPSFAAVTVGLVHGSQPDVLVLCHDAERKTIRGLGDRPIPSLSESIEAHLQVARLTNPAVRAAAVSINTQSLNEAEALAAIQSATEETGLPATDPIRFGAGLIVDAIIS
ncbi:MAG: DUF1611 domain-containing protein [Pseudomonadota bacterium]